MGETQKMEILLKKIHLVRILLFLIITKKQNHNQFKNPLIAMERNQTEVLQKANPLQRVQKD